MDSTSVVLLALVAVFSSILAVIAWRSSRKEEHPCYRCGGLASVEYMGLHYCEMCRNVIVAMIAAVQHDPPYGFPGAKGYLDFPKEKKP